ncbi:MAG: hypothetical protein ABI417_15875 [Coleofasciculaceae cyanobacterium]
MNNKTVNLTLLNATKLLHEFIAKHPGKFYRKALSNADFRQNLIDYILIRIPNRYRTVDDSIRSSFSTATIKIIDKEKLQIEKLIYQGFYYLIRNENKSIVESKQTTCDDKLPVAKVLYSNH